MYVEVLVPLLHQLSEIEVSLVINGFDWFPSKELLQQSNHVGIVEEDTEPNYWAIPKMTEDVWKRKRNVRSYEDIKETVHELMGFWLKVGQVN